MIVLVFFAVIKKRNGLDNNKPMGGIFAFVVL